MIGLATNINCLRKVIKSKTEFILFCPGSDIAMSVGINTRIDPKGYSSRTIRLASDVFNNLKFRERFTIETKTLLSRKSG